MQRFPRLTALILGAGLLLGAAQAQAIDILLTNDDGFEAPGIRALQTALKRTGAKVTLIAPSANRSGSSASLTFAPIKVERPSPGVFSVDSSPASAVILGVSTLLKSEPDLIVSGINSGSNVGPSTPISGTVGATIAAIAELDRPIPAIAVSTDLVGNGEADSPANRRHFADVADFTARLVERLVKNDRVVGLRPGLAFNINYPGLAPGAVKGVKAAVQGRAVLFPPSFEQSSPGVYVSTARPTPPRSDVASSDTILFYRGNITVVPIDADYTAGSNAREAVMKAIAGLTP